MQRFFKTMALALLVTSLPVVAGGNPDPNPRLSRTFIDVTPGADFKNGNFEHRRDRFTNTSGVVVFIAGIDVMMLNPEDLGIQDIELNNVAEVRAAARSAYPEFSFWGMSFWNSSTGIPPLDVPPVTWVFAEFPATTFPVELDPGESFILETRAHNDLFGPANPPPERIGELVIGWRFVSPRCGNGTVEDPEECDDGNLVDVDGCRNSCLLPACGDGVTDGQLGETCDPPGDPAGGNGNDCRLDCRSCGDGIVNSGEACDDANGVDDDECRNDCTIPRCGDGILDGDNGETCERPGDVVGPANQTCRDDCTYCGDAVLDPGEECDDGNGRDTDFCRNDCKLPVCGDNLISNNGPNETCEPPGAPAGSNGNNCRADDCKVCGDGTVDVDAGEECDDANGIDTDSCRNDCTMPSCGDGVVEGTMGETCDPPGGAAGASGNECRVDCTVCGDGVQNPSEDCDDGNAVDDDGCRNDCTAPICGDGIVDTINKESCDDGNAIDDDGCRNDCTAPVCGDGIVDAVNAETCDPPAAPAGVHGLDCRGDCTVCGDGVVDSGEDCDDGNTDGADGCRNDCTAPICGDSIVDGGEDCDDGNMVDDDGCRNDCTTPICGDGIVDGINEEECDDGNAIDTDGCRNDCSIPVCGDGIVDAVNAETCDPPAAPAGVHGLDCRGDCTVCGDGVVDSGEDCDDGNTDGADGCRNDCTAPICGDSIVDGGEDCDDGNMVDDDGCRNDCTTPICGDGIVDGINEEECDDGNAVDTDGCRNDCSIPVCGDGIVDPQNGETCDPPGVPGGAIGNDCRVDCTVCGDGILDSGEECDDGNATDTDVCRNDCTERGVITRNADGANSVVADDLDNDGDYDVVSASGNDNKIAWYENIDTTGDGIGDGEVWVEHLITDMALGARFVTAGVLGYSPYQSAKAGGRIEVDVDGPQGEKTVAGKFPTALFSASSQDNTIRLYENLYGDGMSWVERTISNAVNGASSVHVGDMNDDSCNDVLATSEIDGSVLWFADVMCDGTMWSSANVIDASLGGARAVVAVPLNFDSSLDVLAVGFTANSVVAYINGGAGAGFSPVVISNTAFGATSVQAGDFDFDGDFDAVVATSGDDSITWYENVALTKRGGDGTSWSPHVVSNTAGGASAVFVTDLDFDGFDDIIAAAADDGTITWYENAAGDGTVWTPHTLGTSSPGASSVEGHDLNGDFEIDVIAASFDNDTVAWFENFTGRFPGPCGNSELNAFETCDPPGAFAGGNGNECRDDCTVCGDTIVDADEDCDDGNGVDVGDGCANDCTFGSPPQTRSRAASR